MTIKVAINGYGRIGRNVLRAHYEGGKRHDIQIVAINDLGDPKTNAHLTRYDTAHGKFPGKVSVDGDYMVVNGDRIRVLAKRDPAEAAVGRARRRRRAGMHRLLHDQGKGVGPHLKGGAKKVIISAPGGKDVDATIVYGVNHGVLKATDTVISNASAAPPTASRRWSSHCTTRSARARPDDHHPCLHERPGADRRLSRRPASRARPRCR
jgi:glyceraldehyde 3-phosphate dehydrogenase